MGARFPTVSSSVIQGSVPASGAETLIVLSPPLTLPFDGAAVIVLWYFAQLIGTGTVIVDIRLRRGVGSSLGTLINVQVNITVTAGNTAFHSGCYVDPNPGPGTPQYQISCQGGSTTGAFTTNDASIIALAL